jgi:TIR domain
MQPLPDQLRESLGSTPNANGQIADWNFQISPNIRVYRTVKTLGNYLSQRTKSYATIGDSEGAISPGHSTFYSPASQDVVFNPINAAQTQSTSENADSDSKDKLDMSIKLSENSLLAANRTRVFISYSHKDKSYLERLQVHLEPYRRVGMDIWDDTKIAIGQQWRQEIEHAIAATKVAILLVSADFLASKFIADNELPPLLAAAEIDGAKIIPVIVGACNFDDSELSRFQAANPPSKPLNKMLPAKRDEVWRDVARKVKNSIS